MKLVQRIVMIWLILFLLFWIPKICKASGPNENDERFDMFKKSWQQEFAMDIHDAFAKFEREIDADHTDMGCQIAEEKLKDRIESILHSFADSIRKEVDLDNDRKAYEELHARDEEILRQDRLLDERAAYQDARQFND